MAHIISCGCVVAVSFLGSTNSYVEHIMLCVAKFTNLSPHGSEHSGSLGGPTNVLPPQDWSSINKLLRDLGL